MTVLVSFAKQNIAEFTRAVFYMKKLWDKGQTKLDPIIEAFETGDDLLLDQKLIPYDIVASVSHAMMLGKIGILTKKEVEQLQKGLIEIQKLYDNGKFTLEMGDEDMHTKIERYLTDKKGEVGEKIHTGRSRNDQVLTAIRLFCKAELLEIQILLLDLAESFAKAAKKHEFVAMPGYTHMQQAMPSSVGMWVGSFAESLLDDLASLKSAYMLNNQSPLGSGAGYGVPLNLDREYSAKLLGFEKVQNNSLYVQNSRGKIEASILASLVSVLQTINRFSNDVLLFTTQEFKHLNVSDHLISGSSIMPQKKNIDVAELLRSKLHLVLGYYMQVVSLSSNLISGYNRDYQDSKNPLLASLSIVKQSLLVSKVLLDNIEINTNALKQSLNPKLYATHAAMDLVKEGIPFRKAYKTVKNNLSALDLQNDEKILHQSTHSGGTGNLGLQKLFKNIQLEQKLVKKEQLSWKKTVKSLLGGEKK